MCLYCFFQELFTNCLILRHSISIFSAEAKSIKIKKTAGVTKFKIRLPKYLYTLRVTESYKADKLTEVLPPKLTKTDL